MKTLLAYFFISLLLSCNNDQNQNELYAQSLIKSYDIKAKFNADSGNLNVIAKIQLKLLDHNSDEINFLFSKYALITNFKIISNKKLYSVFTESRNDSIFIKLPNNIKKDSIIILYLEYQIPTYYFTYNKVFRVYRSIRWCPLQYDVISKLNIEITTPKNYEAFSSGDLINIKDSSEFIIYNWKNDYNSGLPLVITPINYYHKRSFTINNKTLTFNYLNNDTNLINEIFNDATNSFKYYNKTIGDYGHNTLGIYEIPDSGGYAMSLESFMVIGNVILNQSKDSYLGSWWVSHEIAHQWIGSGYENSFNTSLSLLIEEGLTEYMRYLFIEDKYGKDSLNNLIKDLQIEFNHEILNKVSDVPISTNIPYRSLYIKGPLIFHYVRKQIGKDNFIKFVRTLYTKYYGQTINYAIFKSELSKFDKGGKIVKRMEEMTEMKGVLPEE